uniref:Uncharacterized protein n=1 Tax=Haptolina ericina TaxID=156174 RepID=A0A7S3AUV7_9EUKA|mmetsp:Transcript_37157/g.84142  ORF Transcript_37157/g.84142 Transcript_37157/m.84142 type:complete len:185 (+) Transcript_37157:505-1059(+)
MLHDTHGIDVGDRMYLVRMHTDRAQFERVPCADLRAEAKLLLDAEHARLMAAGPPPQPTANDFPPPAPPATSPSSTASSSSSPAQGGSEERKRPRGPAPRGKDWDKGKGEWVKRPRGLTTPVTDLTSKVAPGGRPPKGKRWDAEAGCYVAIRAQGQFQCQAPKQPACVEIENRSPQVRRVRARR